MNPKKFLTELKRRNVYKVAIAYAVVAWLLMQIASQIFRSSKFRIGPCGSLLNSKNASSRIEADVLCPRNLHRI